jgi:putative ABC transport system permease protein
MATIRRLPLGAEPDFEIVEADGAASTLASLRSKLSLAALAIGLVTMLGAAVGLMNSLLVSVKERTREIGTRRALGARARDIARQFLAEALLIGLLGSAAGVVLGLLLGNLVALSLEGCFTAPWGWMAAGVLLAAVVSLSSGLLPARRAARLDPIEALRSL